MDFGEGERICAALAAAEGIRTATRGWPTSQEELPCAVVELASYVPTAHGDGVVYACDAEYWIRVFAHTAAEADRAGVGVCAAMEAQGWIMTFAAEADDGEVRVRSMRWKKAA